MLMPCNIAIELVLVVNPHLHCAKTRKKGDYIRASLRVRPKPYRLALLNLNHPPLSRFLIPSSPPEPRISDQSIYCTRYGAVYGPHELPL